MNDAPLTADGMSRLRAAFARVRFAQLLGMELDDAGHGTATLSMKARDELAQVNSIMHGGALASLIDTASAFAVITLLEPGQTTATVNLTIHYLRPVTQGSLKARARVLRSGRRLVTVAIDVNDDAHELIATALTTYARKNQEGETGKGGNG